MTNINQFIFSRTAPGKKLDAIRSMSVPELMAVSQETISRIVKETGYSYKPRSRNKDLRIRRENRAGNHWNSELESIGIYKGKLYVDLYVQMDHTDTTISESYSVFFRQGEYRGKASETNRYGDSEPHYAIYSYQDKAECMRSVLLEYVMSKYSTKLKDNDKDS